MALPRIVVVGGGAGGLELVTRLGNKLGKKDKAEIILVDRNSTHVWKPLYHELATGVLNSSLDQVSFQAHSNSNGYRFQRGELEALDKDKRELTLAARYDSEGEEILPGRTLDYDYLVLALGSVANDFGTEGVAEYCHAIDTAREAEEFRRDMLNTFLRHSNAGSAEQRRMKVAIVGGGPTGVELAAELHKVSDLLHDYGYTDLEESQVDVEIIEAGPRILGPMPDDVCEKAMQDLAELNVKVTVDTMVTKATDQGLYTDNDRFIEADLRVWAAGIKAPEVLANLGLSTRKNNQVKVHESMQSVDSEYIFAMGDCAFCPQGDSAVPPLAQAAHQQAKAMAKNLARVLQGEEPEPFEFNNHGTIISLADYDTIGHIFSDKKGMYVDGKVARFFYDTLYRQHQSAIHGPVKTGATIISDGFNTYLKPKLKMH